jgi:hypothetical protein
MNTRHEAIFVVVSGDQLPQMEQKHLPLEHPEDYGG